jgi:hypothetical protein
MLSYGSAIKRPQTHGSIMKILNVTGHSLKNVASLSRRHLGLSFRENPVQWSGGENSLYRGTFPNGDIVEATIISRKPCVIEEIYEQPE